MIVEKHAMCLSSREDVFVARPIGEIYLMMCNTRGSMLGIFPQAHRVNLFQICQWKIKAKKIIVGKCHFMR